MRRNTASFEARLLGPGPGDRSDVDRALAVFVRNTSPLLRTKTNQIRAKIAAPETPEGKFFFTALYRSGDVIGFAMFGYYPRGRLIVVDHLVVDAEHRGAAAFYVFAQLLQDLIATLEVEVDFTAVELERNAHFGDAQTGGIELARLLGQVGFGEVHADYVLANMDPKDYESRYEGILMLRGSARLYRIRREDLLEIVDTILFDHYLPWYRDFFGEKIESYEIYLRRLYSEFEISVKGEAVVKINGPEANLLLPTTKAVTRSREAAAAIYLFLFAMTAAVSTAVLYVLHVPASLIVPVLLAILAVFVGVAAASSGRALDVFEQIIAALPGARHRSRYQPPIGKKGPNAKRRRLPRAGRRDLPDRLADMQD
jgi:hypothetical protein